MIRTYKKILYGRSLPENMNFFDDGCEITYRGNTVLLPSCLDCPLPICKFDNPGWIKREVTEKRNQTIAQLNTMDWSPHAIAAEMDISVRTIFRVVKAQRELQEAVV